MGSTACFRQDQDLRAKLFSDLAALCVQFRTESFDRLSTNPDMSFSNYCLLGEAVGIHWVLEDTFDLFFSNLIDVINVVYLSLLVELINYGLEMSTVQKYECRQKNITCSIVHCNISVNMASNIPQRLEHFTWTIYVITSWPLLKLISTPTMASLTFQKKEKRPRSPFLLHLWSSFVLFSALAYILKSLVSCKLTQN